MIFISSLDIEIKKNLSVLNDSPLRVIQDSKLHRLIIVSIGKSKLKNVKTNKVQEFGNSVIYSYVYPDSKLIFFFYLLPLRTQSIYWESALGFETIHDQK